MFGRQLSIALLTLALFAGSTACGPYRWAPRTLPGCDSAGVSPADASYLAMLILLTKRKYSIEKRDDKARRIVAFYEKKYRPHVYHVTWAIQIQADGTAVVGTRDEVVRKGEYKMAKRYIRNVTRDFTRWRCRDYAFMQQEAQKLGIAPPGGQVYVPAEPAAQPAAAEAPAAPAPPPAAQPEPAAVKPAAPAKASDKECRELFKQITNEERNQMEHCQGADKDASYCGQIEQWLGQARASYQARCGTR